MLETTPSLINKLTVAELPWLQQAWRDWQIQQAANRIGHAYLIQAATGLAVEVLVRQIAALRFCNDPQPQADERDLKPCGHCSGCQLLQNQQHPDFYHIFCLEDKKEISIAQIRQLIDQQNQTSHQGGDKVIWIQEVEKLSISAFNALLKSLEEPGANTLFLLTSAQSTSLPATIRSRCQKLAIAVPTLSVSGAWLAEQLPQHDANLIKKALRFNWSAPLAAYEWIVQGQFNEQQAWQSALQELLSASQGVNKTIQAWLKWPEPERVFDYFYAWVLSKIRKLGYGLQGRTAEQATEMRAQLQQWLSFQNSVTFARQDWQANANKELVLENLLMEWLRLHQPVQKENWVSSSPTVFQSSTLRGCL